MTRHFIIIYSTINKSSDGIYLKIKIRNREFKDLKRNLIKLTQTTIKTKLK